MSIGRWAEKALRPMLSPVKSIRNTPFARNDTWFYSPLCLGIAFACVTIGAFS
jgi:hypothetical protein